MSSVSMSSIMIILLLLGIVSGLPITWVLGGVAVVSTLLFINTNFLFSIVKLPEKIY